MAKYTGFERVQMYPDKPIYKLDVKQFSPLVLLKDRLDSFERLDLEKVGYKKIKGMIFSLLSGIEIHSSVISPINKIFRGRIFDQSTTQIREKKDFWYPPNSIIDKRGRVNRQYEAIFYGSDSCESVISELNVNINNFIVIVEMELINKYDKLKIVNLGLSQESLEKIEVDKSVKELVTKIEKETYSSSLIINGIPINDYSESFLLENFFHKYMSKKDNNRSFYKITNAISEFWFNVPGINGIAYPSIGSYSDIGKRIHLGTNIALKPDIVDKIYSIKNIWISQIVYISSDRKKIGLEEIEYSNSIDNSGSIVWLDKNEIVKMPVRKNA
jgi:hypothetical protein